MSKHLAAGKLVSLMALCPETKGGRKWGYFSYRVEFPCGFAMQDCILYVGIRSKRQARAWAMRSASEGHERMSKIHGQECLGSAP